MDTALETAMSRAWRLMLAGIFAPVLVFAMVAAGVPMWICWVIVFAQAASVGAAVLIICHAVQQRRAG
jgi:hypothetical protein